MRVHSSSHRSRPRRFDATNASAFWAPPSVPPTAASANSEEAGRAESHDPTRSYPVSSHHPCPSLLPRLVSMRPKNADLPLELPWEFSCPLLMKPGSAPTPPSRMADWASETPFSTLWQPSWPPAAAQSPSATAFGTPTTTHAHPLRQNMHDDAAWRPGRSTHTQSCLFNVCDVHKLDTLVQQGTHTSPSNFKSPELVGGPNFSLSLFDSDVDLVRVALQHLHRIPFLDQDTQCSSCGQVLERFGLAAVCPCAGSRYWRHTAAAHVFYEAAPGSRPPTSEGSSNPAQTSTPLPQWVSLDRPDDVWIPHVKDMAPDAWDLAVTTCLRPATRSPSPATKST